MRLNCLYCSLSLLLSTLGFHSGFVLHKNDIVNIRNIRSYSSVLLNHESHNFLKIHPCSSVWKRFRNTLNDICLIPPKLAASFIKTLKFVVASLLISFSLLRPNAYACKSLSGSHVSVSTFRTTPANKSNKQKQVNPSSQHRHKHRSYSYEKKKTHPRPGPEGVDNYINIAVGGVHATSLPTPSASLIPLALALFVLFQAPIIKSELRARLGHWAVSYHELQLAFLLSDREMRDFIADTDAIQRAHFATRANSHAGSSPEPDVHMTEALCVSALRLSRSLVAASYSAHKARDSVQRRDSFLVQLREKSVVERAKYSLDTQSHPHPHPTTSGARSTHYGVHTELRTSPSYLVLTLLLVAVGPCLHVPGAGYLTDPLLSPLTGRLRPPSSAHQSPPPSSSSSRKPLRREQVERLLRKVPAYVRALSEQQQRARIDGDGGGGGCGGGPVEEAGFEVELVWTPASMESCIDDLLLREGWPELLPL